jgi:prevent-host-death family protein
MRTTTLSNQDFEKDPSQAQKAAQDGPVFITSDGKTAYVLLTIEEYRRLTGGRRSIVDALAMPGIADIELEIPECRDLPRAVDFS